MKQIALSLVVMTASGTYVWEHARQAAAGELLATASAGDLEPARAVELAPVPELQPRLQRTALAVATQDVAGPAQPAPRQPVTGTVAAAIVKPTVDGTATAAIGHALPQAANTFATSAASGISAARFMQSAVAVSLPETDVPIPRPRPADQPHLATAKQPVAARFGLVAGGAYSDGLYIGPATDAYYGTIQIEAVIQGGALVGIKVLQYPSDRRTSVRINHQALPMLRDEAVSAQSENVDIISGATLTSRAFIRSLGGALQQAAS